MARRPFLISLSCMSVLFWPSGSKGKLSRKPDCTGKQRSQSAESEGSKWPSQVDQHQTSSASGTAGCERAHVLSAKAPRRFKWQHTAHSTSRHGVTITPADMLLQGRG